MIPFPGESVQIQDAVDLTGGGEVYDLWGTIVRRADTRSMTSGTTWRAWVYQGDVDYLEESGLDCDVSWVVEVASGTVTFTAGELFDPTYSDITSPTTPLGTYTVTGPATVVIPSGFTADDVLTGGDSLLVELVGVSGSAQVQQVKLRVWPTAGVLGGWSEPLPSWSTTPALPVGYETGINVAPNEVASTPEASWDATMAQGVIDWAASAPGPHTFGLIGHGSGYLEPTTAGGVFAFHGTPDGGVTWGTFATLNGAILVIVGENWETAAAINPALSLVDGVDYVRPPTEVRFESGAYMVQQVGDGSTGWVNPYAYAGTGSEPSPVAAPTLDLDSLDALTITNLGGGDYEIDLDGTVGGELTTPGPDGSESESVGLPTDSRYIVVYLAHTAALTPPAWPAPAALAGSKGGVVGFGVGTPGVDFDPMLTYSILPPYRLWVPVVTVLEPHQIFQRRDHLGAGSNAVFDRGTRQASSVVFGTF